MKRFKLAILIVLPWFLANCASIADFQVKTPKATSNQKQAAKAPQKKSVAKKDAAAKDVEKAKQENASAEQTDAQTAKGRAKRSPKKAAVLAAYKKQNKKNHNKRNITPQSLIDINGDESSSAFESRSTKIVFVRASVVASAIDALLYDVTSGTPEYIASIVNNQQLHHWVTPGRRVFMLVSGDSVDYMMADVQSDLTYYSLVKPSMGAWKPSFTLHPIKSRVDGNDESMPGAYYFDDEQMIDLLALKAPTIDSKKVSSLQVAVEDISQRHQNHWQRWLDERADSLELKTLNTKDGH